MPPMAPIHCARGLVPSTAPALKSFMTSPAKAARHGYDAGDKEQLDLSDACKGSHDEHDDEAKDLHWVDARLTAALRSHDGGDKGEQRDDDGRNGAKGRARWQRLRSDGGSAQADDTGVRA